ncbi:MAG: AraC family transcriptional regulator [Bacteroidales bacterium]|jgi:AraC-like DNA-binding protein|nr:AraC family transcriptional regulator [Bacteroidales bacterium]
MIAELEKISYNDGGGFRAVYIMESNEFWHFHPEYQLVLNIKSNGTRIVGDSVELFDKNDLVLIAGNIPHCWNYYRKNGVLPEEHGIILHFRIESLGESFLSQHELHKVRDLLIDSERGIAFSTGDAIKAEPYLKNMVESSGIDKIIAFFNLLNILCSSQNRSFLCSENYKLAYDERGNKKMVEVYNHVRENYFKDLSLKSVSTRLHMSPAAFSKFFKKNSGAGFIEYVNRVRTNKACYLLRETEYQVNDIARECGFSSISNFNKQFRKTEGLAPSDYRAQYR